MNIRFQDRKQASERLAAALNVYRDTPAVVYALPRGGVVIGRTVADRLDLPLDLLIPRKIGHPADPEAAIAAVTETGPVVHGETSDADVDPAWFRKEVAAQRAEASRRRQTYLGSRQPPDVSGKTAIIVDDGMATGLTMRAAIDEARRLNPASVVIAVPVAPADVVRELERETDRVISLHSPEEPFGAIGSYYEEFDQVGDAEVVALMTGSAGSIKP